MVFIDAKLLFPELFPFESNCRRNRRSEPRNCASDKPDDRLRSACNRASFDVPPQRRRRQLVLIILIALVVRGFAGC